MSHKPHSDLSRQKYMMRIWPFRYPMSRTDALAFWLAIAATIVGFVIGLLEFTTGHFLRRLAHDML